MSDHLPGLRLLWKTDWSSITMSAIFPQTWKRHHRRVLLFQHTMGPRPALDINPHIRGCIATGGADKLVKIWNVDDSSGKMNVTW